MNIRRTTKLLLVAAAFVACDSSVETPSIPTGTTASSTGGAGGSTVTTTASAGGGGVDFPCGEDCSLIATPTCLMSVCNEGGYPGPLGICTVVPREAGLPCDDGLFCTVDDACDGGGVCAGGAPNDCGLETLPCEIVACDEATQTCSADTLSDGEACTPLDLCEVDGVCFGGACYGSPKDCSLAPNDNDCTVALCNSTNGACEFFPDAALEGQPCLSGDLCMEEKTCQNGLCEGGSPKDCTGWAQPVGCFEGECDPTNGACVPVQQMVGDPCTSVSGACVVGVCNANNDCEAQAVPNGTACNDYSACTSGDVCAGGVCGGTPVTACTVFLEESFDSCPPPGWTLAGGWECGPPAGNGPSAPFQGAGFAGTDLNANYANNLNYADTYVETPPVSLVGIADPELSWYDWVHTEGQSYDGYNVSVSTDGGATFAVVTAVDPPYDLVVAGQPAYGGNLSAQGWTPKTADLGAYYGQTIIVRFNFRSDGSIVAPGVFLDAVTIEDVGGPNVPIAIDTVTVGAAFAGEPFSASLARSGGSTDSTWSIVGGTNIAWLGIDPVTGTLSGTPTLAEAGPTSVTVRLQENTVPTNFDEVTLNFGVFEVFYSEGFEDCINLGWSLLNSWACGAPTSGPQTARTGSNVLATTLAGDYPINLAWATNVATSTTINLPTGNPMVQWHAWSNTEGATFDGWNLKISTNGGATFAIVTSVSPSYALTIDGQSAWGGDDTAQQYRRYTADLSAYAGQPVVLRFALRSDGVVSRPGVYIDDLRVYR